jgi:adenosine deaminase
VAEQALAVALRQRPEGVTAFDVAGDERAVAAAPAFAPLFRRARREGLHLLAHAGEAAGPESVAAALDLYGARRIGHGTHAAEDPALLARLAAEQVVLEVCPSSNVALHVVASFAAHPLPIFLAAGVPCAISTDDPSLFGTDLVTEHVRLHREAGVSLGDLARMAAVGFRAAALEEGPTGRETRACLAAWESEALAWSSAP